MSDANIADARTRRMIELLDELSALREEGARLAARPAPPRRLLPALCVSLAVVDFVAEASVAAFAITHLGPAR